MLLYVGENVCGECVCAWGWCVCMGMVRVWCMQSALCGVYSGHCVFHVWVGVVACTLLRVSMHNECTQK